MPGQRGAESEVAAIADELQRATRDFSRRLGDVEEAAYEARLRRAEREASDHLEHAKERVDALLASMVEVVQREASAIRREAEEGIRARWDRVEEETRRQLDDAARVAEAMVAERQERIAELSDTIASRAETLAAGLEDAERVRAQFTAFIRALSATADAIAADWSPPARPQPITRLPARRPGALAA
jgi:F0F1-type ATP synthase membrane subunit b/b'